MEEAGEEERRLAIENGRFHEGKPYTRVITDGGWSQRSHGHRYSALSGCAVIIGFYTNKILHLGVKNKFCSTCARLIQRGEKPEEVEHVCFRNWSASSCAMESASIVEGFKSSYEQHGLLYTEMVADGDSSVLCEIRKKVSYGPAVKKYECANHVVKNFTKSLYALSNKSSHKKILTKGPTGSITSMTKCARSSISKNAANHGTPNDLRDTLAAVPRHVLGDHRTCSEDCDSKGTADQTSIYVKDDFLSQTICSDIDQTATAMAGKADRLILNVTTNSAEMYMHLVAKFIGGKQINRSQQGSYTFRCQAAALSHTYGPKWHSVAYKNLTAHSPDVVFKKMIAAKQRAVEYAGKRRRESYENEESGGSKRRRLIFGGQQCSTSADAHYGPNAMEEDISEEEMKTRCEEYVAAVTLSEPARRELEERTKGQATNTLWLEERRKRLTASWFGLVCKRYPYSSCKPVVQRMLYPKSDLQNNRHLQHGRKYEQHALLQYKRENVSVQECGLFIHDKFGFLGASPDGLIGEDGLIEVKCPSSAVDMTIEEAIDKVKSLCLEKTVDSVIRLKRNHDYYYQVQGQLQICKRSWCDFVVWILRTKPPFTDNMFIERIVRDDEFWKTKMLPKLQTFYKTCLLPELVDPRERRNMEIRDPPHILEAQIAWAARPKKGGRARKANQSEETT